MFKIGTEEGIVLKLIKAIHGRQMIILPVNLTVVFANPCSLQKREGPASQMLVCLFVVVVFNIIYEVEHATLCACRSENRQVELIISPSAMWGTQESNPGHQGCQQAPLPMSHLFFSFS